MKDAKKKGTSSHLTSMALFHDPSGGLKTLRQCSKARERRHTTLY